MHYQTNSDQEILGLLHRGEEAALTIIYQRYWRRLYTSAFAILRDEQACEDIIQDVFMTLWLKRETLDIKVSLVGYLLSSVKYEVFRQIRSGKVREDIFDDLVNRIQAGSDYSDVEYKDLCSHINNIVQQLPEKCRMVYKLSREEQLSHKEIAEQMNISTKTVENHLTKALRFLRMSLSQTLTLGLLSLIMK